MEAKIEVTQRKFQTQFKEVESRAIRGRGTGIGTGTAKTPKFNGTTSWALFRCQFEPTPEHICWTLLEKSTYLITALQG
jgi:hypothetical protein